jgi:beta-galactosidase
MYDFPVANRQEGFMDSDDGIVFTQNDYRKYTNDKGLVTRNRKTKKDVFYLYKSWWNKKETTVYITSRRLKYYPKDKPVDIKVYSNATSLTLYQNDKIVSTLTTSGERSGVTWTFKNIKKERLQDTFRVVAPDGTANEITWTYK